MSVLFIETRFIEPYYISVETTKIEAGFEKSSKIILISDLHVGMFTDEFILTKMVEKINTQTGIEAVLIAGDLTYFHEYSKKIPLEKMLKPLSKIRFPVYWTLGNHDIIDPGEHVRVKLTRVMKEYGATLLNNEAIKFSNFTLV
jgi:predicted MPP superfamily phosphohydrolase